MTSFGHFHPRLSGGKNCSIVCSQMKEFHRHLACEEGLENVRNTFQWVNRDDLIEISQFFSIL